MKPKIWAILLLFLIFPLFHARECFSSVRVNYPPEAYVGQEIYNWIDVINEPGPVQRIEYYRDGALQYVFTGVNNKRYNFDVKFNSPGTHYFAVKMILYNGAPSYWEWQTSVVAPTKNLTKAVGYAEKYALTINGKYGEFENADCTNFMSQILHDPLEGGGFPQETGNSIWWHNWFFVSTLNYSRTWAVVDEFHSYMRDYKGIINLVTWAGDPIYIGGYGTYTYPPLLNAGIIRYHFPTGYKHNVFIVTKDVDSEKPYLIDGPQPVVNYHSRNYKHINWTLISRNDGWAKTFVTFNRIKWDYQ